jgi:hypothetical protein
VDPNPDGIGIYADKAATVNTVNAAPLAAVEVYLVLTRPSITNTSLGVAGWECKVVVPDNAVVWGWNLPGDHWLNVGTPPDFQVGYGLTPLPSSSAVLLMTFIILVTDTNPARFYVRASMFNSGRFNLPVYVAWGDVSRIIPLHPYPGGPDQPSFRVNPGPTPNVAASWGQVKALYN